MNLFDEESRRFAAQYANLSDEELVKLAQDPWSLSDPAWEALEDEFDRRHLELPTPEAVAKVESLEKRDLVLLRRFRDLPEAMLAKGKLESRDIPCCVADDNTVRMDWFWSNLVGGVKILVDKEHFSEAALILNEPIPDQIEFEQQEIYQQPRCPQCGSLDVSFEGLDKPLAYGSMMVFPLPVSTSGWTCHACGNRWEDGN